MTIPSDTVARAAGFAAAAHHKQRYGSAPYTYHLEQVAYVLRQHAVADVPEELEAAAWLHDVLEDTPVSESYLREFFGAGVADLVVAVTDEPGRDRKERKTRTYPKIRAAGAKAVRLKLADRIANFSSAVREGRQDLLTMYRSEHPEFRAALYRPLENLDMWGTLEDLLCMTTTTSTQSQSHAH